MFYVNLIKNNHNLIGLDGVFVVLLNLEKFLLDQVAFSLCILLIRKHFVVMKIFTWCQWKMAHIIWAKIVGRQKHFIQFVHQTHLNFIKLQYSIHLITISSSLSPSFMIFRVTVWQCFHFIFKYFYISIQQHSCIWIMNCVNRRQRRRRLTIMAKILSLMKML